MRVWTANLLHTVKLLNRLGHCAHGTPSQFQTRLEVEVSQRDKALPETDSLLNFFTTI